MQISDISSNIGSGVASLPVGLPANDSTKVLFLCVSAEGSLSGPTINTPSGWTALSVGQSTGSVVNSHVFYKQGDGSSLVTVTLGATAFWVAAVAFVVDDANVSSIIDVAGKSTGSATTNHPSTASVLTTTVASALVVGVYGLAYSGVVNPSLPASMGLVSQVDSGGAGAALTLLVGSYLQAVAGGTGASVAHTTANAESAGLLFVIKPYPGPTRANVLYPNGGESLTAGTTVALNCTAASSPTAAAATLQYEYSYSSNNGSSWTTIGLTSAGVTTKSWTVPTSPLSGGWLIRVRAKDPATGLFSLVYDQSDAAFSVVAEVAPSAPTGLSPNTSYPAKNKAALVTLSWVHGGGTGNPQTDFTLQWSRDGFASHTATVGPTATATPSTTIDFSAEAVGTVITWRVKTKGFSLYSVYSSNAAFVVASLPTTPNITSPTAGSPPTTPNPTFIYTITSGEQQIARRIRITQGGGEVYNSGWEPTTSQSLVSPFAFANGTAYSLLLAIRNQYGLDSAEDTETFTPAYSGPAKPVLRATAVNEGGYVLLDTSFSPPRISGCQLWLAADRITGLSDGSSVASWPDQSGNGNDAAQATAGNRPAYKTNIVNGKPVVRFDGTNDYLDIPDSASLSITGDMTVFVVVNPTDFAGYRGILGKTVSNFPAPYDFYLVQTTGLPAYFRGNGSLSATVNGTAAPGTGAFSLLTVSMSGTTVNHYKNGASNGSGTLSTTVADGGGTLKIGSRADLVTLMKGDIAEMIIYDSALSTANRQIVEAYLSDKYGLSTPTSYLDLWVYEPGLGRQSAIRLTPHLPPGAIYSDHQRASGVAYQYFARAYSSTGLYTESDDTGVITLTLSNMFLGAVDRVGVNSNSLIQPLGLTNLPPQSLGLADLSVAHGLRGRRRPLPVFGQAAWRTLNVSVIARSVVEKDNLMAAYALNTDVCVRDQFGNKIFGRMTKPQIVPEADFFRITFTVTQSKYTEAI